VVSKANPYIGVVSSALAVRSLAQAGVAIENECKSHIASEWAKKNKKTMKEALSMFDRSFTPYYIGEIWSGDNVSYFRKTGGGVPTSNRIPGEWGQADFKEEYLDAEATRYAPATDNNGTPVNNLVSDQVHHFVGYMSAGINGAYWSSTALTR